VDYFGLKPSQWRKSPVKDNPGTQCDRMRFFPSAVQKLRIMIVRRRRKLKLLISFPLPFSGDAKALSIKPAGLGNSDISRIFCDTSVIKRPFYADISHEY